MIQIFKGDCLEIMKSLHDNSVDMILADVPYKTSKCKWDSIINFDLMWRQLERVSNEDTAILLFAQSPFDKVLACSNLKMFRHEWIWEKSHATGHFNAKKMPMKAHENILVFYGKLPTYNPQKTTGHTRKVATKKASNNSEIYGDNTADTSYDSTERYPRSVLKFASDKQKSRLHPTQKPVSLLEYLIQTYTAEGDVVLDFCMGSGSTGVACKKTSRNFIGIEIMDEYFSIAEKRINDA